MPTSPPGDIDAIPVANFVGDRMSVKFYSAGRCTLTFPADPGGPRSAIVSVTDDGALLVTRDDGLAYVGPNIDIATFDRLRQIVDITAVELEPVGNRPWREYPVCLADDFQTLCADRVFRHRARQTSTKVSG